MNSSLRHNSRSGAVLLAVLLIIMVITILSLGFLSQSDVELACGKNMELRSRMDYLAESGLEHAKGLILNPQDLQTEYYTGAAGIQLVSGSSDYYNITVLHDNSDPTDQCNYIIDCNAYELKNGEHIGQSNLTASLRLDPCIALWTGVSTALSASAVIHGDIYCGGTLDSMGTIDGDVFAASFSGTQAGRKYNTYELSLAWPAITVSNFMSKSGVTYQSSNYALNGNVSGMLLVNGDLTIPSGSSVNITAVKNLPSVYVAGNMIIEDNAVLNIDGLAAVNGNILINGSANLNVLGGLFTKGALFETVCDSSNNKACAVLHNGAAWSAGKYNDALKFDGSNDYAQVDQESVFDITSQITVSAWIKVNAFNRDFQAIVTKGDSAWRLQRYSNTSKIEFACSGLSLNQYGNIWSNKSVNDSQWHHVAGVYNGTAISVYIDGVLDISANTSGQIGTNNYKVMIGENAQATGRYWNGWIDDVQIYNRALDAGEISTIKSGGTVSNLVSHWSFDESSGAVNITASPVKTAVNIFSSGGTASKWGQAEGAFYRSIERK